MIILKQFDTNITSSMIISRSFALQYYRILLNYCLLCHLYPEMNVSRKKVLFGTLATYIEVILEPETALFVFKEYD